MLCVYDSLWFFFPGCLGGEGREEGREEGEFREGSGRKEEAMSVGESTTSTVHVTCMTYACTCGCTSVTELVSLFKNLHCWSSQAWKFLVC